MYNYAILKMTRISLTKGTIKKEKILLRFDKLFRDFANREFLFGMKVIEKRGDDLIEIFLDYFEYKHNEKRVFHRLYKEYSWVQTFNASDDDSAKLIFEVQCD